MMRSVLTRVFAKRALAAISIVGLGLLASPVSAAPEEDETSSSSSASAEKVLITDPAELIAAGINPGEQVYKVVRPETSAQASETGLSASYFGTSSGFSELMPRAFQGRTSAFTYSSGGTDTIFSTTAAENFADAQIHLPDGALIEFFRVWVSDSNAGEDMHFFLFESCLPAFDFGTPTSTILGTLDLTVGAAGNASDFLDIDVTADTTQCTYRLRAKWGDTSNAGTTDSSLTLQKARVQWQRQISPAPGTATFGDVPTSHPFFQFVEALASSGITAGCGSGNYCVNDPVTRGQMAVFLSRGLGLDWGF